MYRERTMDRSGYRYNLTALGGNLYDLVYQKDGLLAVPSTPGAVPLVVAAHPHSLADNEFIDESDRHHEGDSEYNIMGHLPAYGGNRHIVHAKGHHDGATWTVEMKRKLAAPSPTTDAQFTFDVPIGFAVGVFDGANGDNEAHKSITPAFKTLMVRNAAPPPVLEAAAPAEEPEKKDVSMHGWELFLVLLAAVVVGVTAAGLGFSIWDKMRHRQ